MEIAKHRWGSADVIDGKADRVPTGNNRGPEGGPVHQYLLAKREAKLKRRAERYAKQTGSK